MMHRKSLALALTLAVLTLGFFWPVQVRVAARFWGQFFDVTHIPLLAWLATVLCYALPERGQPTPRRYALAFALAVLFAVAVEILQPYFGRTRSLADVINGSLGAALALTSLAAWRRTGKWFWRGGHALALAGKMMVALWPA